MSLTILLNEQIKFIALKTRTSAQTVTNTQIQLCGDDCTQIELTVMLLNHFIEGFSTTVIKIAEKVGLLVDLHQLSKQDKLLPEVIKLRVAHFLDHATCLLSIKSIESLGIPMTPVQKNDAHSTFNFMMQLSNAPLYNLNSSGYTKVVISLFIQRLIQCQSSNLQLFEWLAAILIYFCGLRRAVELADVFKVCTKNIRLFNVVTDGLAGEADFKVRYDLGFKCLTCSTNPKLSIKVCYSCAQSCH